MRVQLVTDFQLELQFFFAASRDFNFKAARLAVQVSIFRQQHMVATEPAKAAAAIVSPQTLLGDFEVAWRKKHLRRKGPYYSPAMSAMSASSCISQESRC